MVKIKVSGHYLTCMLNKENFRNMQSYYGQQFRILELYVIQAQKLGLFNPTALRKAKTVYKFAFLSAIGLTF